MVEFHEIGRLPAPADNCAIAIRTLVAGTAVTTPDSQFILRHTILEGHRFAIEPIPANTALLSWGMPFGKALRDIVPGEYVCNTAVLDALSNRSLDFTPPDMPNFADDLANFELNPNQFQPAPALPLKPNSQTFMGFQRPGKRGVGTRNIIVLLGANALVSGFVQQLEKEVKPLIANAHNIDGIAAVAHTEGSQKGNNNQELLLRTLAGFMVHPNVGAVLVLDAGNAGVTNAMLQTYANQHGYELAHVQHQFISLTGPFTEDLRQCAQIVEAWLPQLETMQRTPQPISELKIALQCGGSDAFSGISGNPLAAWVSKEVIQAGGSAALAETDELIGAESYVLQKVRDLTSAQRFLEMVEQFQARAGWHGRSAHGNPSGGNLYRGLYNIYLKSLGAATKRHPDVRLDAIIAYGERMSAPGYYFMDSPGNDLESIAGQVAAGCNLIYFVTGNGSITNFPFVPTIKIVTTSARYALLPNEMDVNAGAYLDGAPLAELGQDMLNLTVSVASGQPSVGEKAQHAQVQIWRNWQLTDHVNPDQIKTQFQPDGQPFAIQPPVEPIDITFDAWQTNSGIVTDRIGLILPSSLCSGQIAQMAADRLNALTVGKDKQVSRFVSLVHTEGCGGSTQPEYVNIVLGYLAHPLMATGLILEHGCENTHNDFWRQNMRTAGLDPKRFGWASIQIDGGIEQALSKIEAWFLDDCATLQKPTAAPADLSNIRLGIMSEGVVDAKTAVSIAQLIQQISAGGGTAVLPANDSLATNEAFTTTLTINVGQLPTLGYAHRVTNAGFHLMVNPGSQWVETMTGLGATGIELILACITSRTQQGHPMIPVVQVAQKTAASPTLHADLDLVLTGSSSQQLDQLLGRITAVLSRTDTTRFHQKHNIGFQITRGQLGISL